MARADRLARLDEQRRLLEADYRDALVAALTATAAGRWGLFGHNRDKTAERLIAPVLDELMTMGDDIDAMRASLGVAPFALHAEFRAARGPVGAQAPGEPKQARTWLTRLADEAETTA